MAPAKRDRSDKTPSPPKPPSDPASRPPKRPAPKPKHPSTKPPPQNHPTSRQPTTYGTPNYDGRPTSSIQGEQEGDLSGAGLGYGQPDPRHNFTARSALGSSAQQPPWVAPVSAFDPNAPPREPRPTDWTPPSIPDVPPSGRRALPPPPPPPYAGGKNAMDPPPSHHKQTRGLPPPSPYAYAESEDEVLIQLKGEYSTKSQGVKWDNISQGMKARRFDRSADWCKKRWSSALDPNSRRDWSRAEDDALRTLKGESNDWDWRVISSDMAKRGFHRSFEACRARWQDVVRPKISSDGEPLSLKEEDMLRDLRAEGHSFPEIVDKFEREKLFRRNHTLTNAHRRLTGKNRPQRE